MSQDSSKVVSNVECKIPKADLDDLHEFISNYLDYWCGGCGEQAKSERKKWRPMAERLWRAANGYGYTNHPKTLEELEDE